MKKYFWLALLNLCFLFAGAANAQSVLETYPGLQKFVAAEHESNLYFGFGVNPLNIISGKVGFSASLFQVHFMKDRLDWEIFNGSFGSASGNQFGSEQFFMIRTAPKIRVFKGISIGPVFGAEFVHFPDVSAELTKNSLYTPASDFSTVGLVYGGTIAETFEIGAPEKNTRLRVSETLYKENYSVTTTNNGWSYYYLQNSLNTDKSPIAASTVFVLEVSYLF